MANKVKSIISFIVAAAAFVVLPVQLVAWAEDLAEEKAREAELRMEGRVDAMQSTAQATHNYDFFDIRQTQVEQELIALEEAEAEGEELTPTEVRKKSTLQKNLESFEASKLEALEKLKGDTDETE
jgi:muconolactone delta-isomerase